MKSLNALVGGTMRLKSGEVCVYTGGQHMVVCDGLRHFQVWSNGERRYDGDCNWPSCHERKAREKKKKAS